MPQKRPNGGGSITKRKDGRYHGRAYVLTPDGTRKRVSVYGRTWEETDAKLAELIRNTRRGVPTPTGSLRFGDYLDYWLEHVVKGQLRPSTYASYEPCVRLHIKPALGSKRLSQLTPAEVRTFLQAKVKEVDEHGRRRLSARTVQYLHAILRAALQHAVREELVARNVARLVQPPRVPHEEVRPLDDDEIRAFLAAGRTDRLYAAYLLMIGLGLRRGEVLGLRWTDVDLDARVVRVRRTLQRVNGEILFSEPKTPRSRRTVPLPRTCVAALRWHRLRQQAECASAGRSWDPGGLVFATRAGRPVEPRNFNRSVYAVCDRAGIRRIRVHDLRHTCASLLLARGVDARTIMDTLGHSAISLTLNIYAHVMPAAHRAAAEAMDAALRRGRQL